MKLMFQKEKQEAWDHGILEFQGYMASKEPYFPVSMPLGSVVPSHIDSGLGHVTCFDQ